MYDVESRELLIYLWQWYNFFSGCKIFSYDHTVDFPATRGKNIHFKKIGLGDGEHLQSLKNIIATNGHQNTTIEYLKVSAKAVFRSLKRIIPIFRLTLKATSLVKRGCGTGLTRAHWIMLTRLRWSSITRTTTSKDIVLI